MAHGTNENDIPFGDTNGMLGNRTHKRNDKHRYNSQDFVASRVLTHAPYSHTIVESPVNIAVITTKDKQHLKRHALVLQNNTNKDTVRCHVECIEATNTSLCL